MSMACVCCSHRSEHHPALDAADSLIESRPDSALAILSAINPAELHSRPLAARYAVLMSMALDKNYIDTADFTVIQPAIDYYLTHGTPDERLRTLYYTGIIHKNRGERNEAMSCFMDAAELRDQVTDSLVLARNYVMQGVYYFQQFQIGSSTDKYLQAARLFESKRPDLTLNCYLDALYNTVAKSDELRADSIMKICDNLIDDYPDYLPDYLNKKLTYLIDFGTDSELRNEISAFTDTTLTDWQKYVRARAYLRLGDAERALQTINSINVDNFTEYLDMLEYVKGDIFALSGDYRAAADCYRNYIDLSAKDFASLLNSELPYSDTRHNIKLQHTAELHRRNTIILLCIIAACLIALFAVYVNFRLFRARTRRIITEEQNRNLVLQNENLIREKETAEIEKRASDLEVENLRLQNDANELMLSNLRLEKSRLENERESLRELLSKKSDLDPTVHRIICERLQLLNGLIAQEITKKSTFGAPYQNFITTIHDDKVSFLDSTRLAFSVSHPQFMQYLEACGLSTEEIYLCCLYAIGLRGKEVGEYTGLKRHYIIGSEIRRKFGLSEHDTNLGKYILQLLRGDIPKIGG